MAIRNPRKCKRTRMVTKQWSNRIQNYVWSNRVQNYVEPQNIIFCFRCITSNPIRTQRLQNLTKAQKSKGKLHTSITTITVWKQLGVEPKRARKVDYEIKLKNKEDPGRQGSPGRFSVPNRVILEREVVHVAIHVINISVFIEELRLLWVNWFATKNNIFAAISSRLRISYKDVWQENGAAEMGFWRWEMGSQWSIERTREERERSHFVIIRKYLFVLLYCRLWLIACSLGFGDFWEPMSKFQWIKQTQTLN